jgi:hypothetical protein
VATYDGRHGPEVADEAAAQRFVGQRDTAEDLIGSHRVIAVFFRITAQHKRCDGAVLAADLHDPVCERAPSSTM